MQNVSPEWIAVDWGTSNLRAWAMAGDVVLAEAGSDHGMGQLTPNAFEAALLDIIAPWLGAQTIPVIACGMVGAKQGWVEAPYAAVPCPPVGQAPVMAPTTDARISVTILPGLSQLTPPDVMRGEETQIAGFLAHQPTFDGVLCMPGTHTKWVHISAGEVVSFKTFMTGELFALLSQQSVLKHMMGDDFQMADFQAALRDAMARPEAIAGQLFALRARGLVADASGSASAALSGLLIGAELAASKPYWLGQRVAILGAGRLARLYASALAGESVQAEEFDVTDATLRGLSAAYEQWRKNH